MLVSEDTDIAALLTDAAGKVVSWSDRCETLFGIPAPVALGNTLASLLDMPGREMLLERWSGIHKQCDALELGIPLPDGSCRSVELTLLSQYDVDGALTGFVAFFVADPSGKELSLVGRMPLSSVIDVLPGTFYVIREDGTFALWNKTLERVTAMTPEELKVAHALDMYDITDKRIIAARIKEVFEHDAQVFVEANYLDKYGNATPYLLCGARIECRSRRYLCGMGIDISDRRAQEEVLRIRERALHATSNGLVIARCADGDNPIEYVNPAFERISGYSASEVIGRDSRFMASPGLDDDERDRLRKAVSARRQVNVVLRNLRKNGEVFWNDLTITPVADGTGKVTHFIGVINDVTALKHRTALLEHEVNHDPLTGLANRTLLWDRLEQAIHMAQRNKSLVAVVLIDLNGFKQINDSFGHEAGDEVLKVVAKRLQAAVRDSDTVARLSGDEFVLVLVNQPSLRYTLRMVERLRDALSRPAVFERTEIGTGASIGVSVYPHDGTGTVELVRAADVAMYHAKASQKDEACFFSSDMKSTGEARQKREDSMRNAIDRRELFLMFQPRIDLHAGHINALEALVRWRHPEHGVLLPAAFLSDAEQNGMIVPIGREVLEQACDFLARRQRAGMPPLPVALNSSSREFSQPGYVDNIAAVIERHGLRPEMLEVELREDGLNNNHQLGLDIMSQLRDLGVRRSLDAFGEGMSDLNYVQKLPLTHIKVARSAINRITEDARSGAVVKALIDIGHDLGVKVIAKGVETRTQMDFLRANACDEMQGRLFSEPLSESALQGMLTASAAI
ncbi:EAL domain-containing protein [Massilia sp. RP-1-19]|uniref:EAL domain-containing protein n=1 Tax=Massilia polaris TaxID=2728846 RepID=A0A848HLD7_9BURK|nr:bifunctional diguanylate cyclase/phosphodiesterase [Massilia polaris]NML62165.1 EAL domain-containing protein [Massilia polaris]